MNQSQKNIIIWTLASVFALLLIILYMTGWRVTSEFRVGRTGTLIMDIPHTGVDIYINNDEKITTTEDEKNIEKKLSPKTHKIIVSLKDFYPWTKDISMPSNASLTLRPMFVPQNPSGFIITEIDKDYYTIKKNIVANKFPEEAEPKLHPDGSVRIFVKNNTIFAIRNGEVLEVLKSETKIKNLDFYKNRNDVVLFSVAEAVYAIEIEKVGTQNFMPIYKGRNPFFVVETDSTIYLEDNGMLMEVLI